MPRFLYELTLAGDAESDAPRIGRALSHAARRLAAGGAEVTLLGAYLAPSRSRLVCAFDAADAEVVRRVARTAQVPGTGVVQLVPILGDGTASNHPPGGEGS